MQAKPTLHICITCKKKWQAQNVEDEPVYTQCDSCYAKMIQAEMEIAGNGE